MSRAAKTSPSRNLSYWLRAWQETRDVSEQRKKADDTRIHRYVVPYLGRRAVTAISSTDISAWIDELLESGVGAATVHASLMAVRQAIDLAYEELGVLRTNPVRGMSIEGQTSINEPDLNEVLTEDEIQRILNHVGPTYKAMILFAARTGARWSEVLGLQPDDLQFEWGRARVGRLRITNDAGYWQEQEGEPRFVPLTPDLITLLQEHLENTKSWRTPGNDFVFLTNRDHQHPRQANFTLTVWRPTLEVARIDPKGKTFNSLRHAAAVRMIDEGLDVDEISRILGHKAPRTTQLTYRRFFVGREAKRN